MKQFEQLSSQGEKDSLTMKDHEKFMRDMNNNYN